MTGGTITAMSDTHFCVLLRAAGTAKELARQTGRPWRTIERYLSGRARPDPFFLLSLMRANDVFAAGLMHLAGRIDAARAINEAANARRQLELDDRWRHLGRTAPPRA